ncbi:MAG: YHYH protein [Candidatus Obscuribacterales bacterium]|nr:YHYH protein [Candidatus Obscuribacterales bacterium]
MKRYSIPAIALLLTANLSASAHYEEHSSKHVNHKAKSSKELGPLPTQFDPWDLLKKALSPAYAASNEVSIVIEGDYRIIKSNGLPDHETGAFPNRGNPNTIREQHYTFRMPAEPIATGKTTWLGMYPFGVAINGIPFDPGAAEWWDNDPYSGWQYEAMALGPRLGIDQNNAHVQPNGAYHYHGPPTGLIDELSHAPKPTLLGYAADGFPIYGPFGHSNPNDASSGMTKLHSSYRVKQGLRPNGPGGDYDGLFTQDYEYKKGLGQLDECNGRFGVTEEFPKGTYYYVITDSFP